MPTSVLASQTLASMRYADGDARSVTPEEVTLFADLSGVVSDIEINPLNAEVLHLTYANYCTVTYCHHPKACVEHSEPYTINSISETPEKPTWEEEETYNVGDTIVIDGIIFKCMRQHTSGTTSNTRNPTIGANKSTWRVIGFESGADNSYSSQYRYEAGVIITYLGKTYKRLNYLINGGASPTNSQY